MKIVVFFSLLSLCAAADSQNFTDFTTKVKNMGVSFFTLAEIKTMMKCMEPSFLKSTSMSDLKQPGMNCIMKTLNVNIGKYTKAMGIMNNFNQCIDPENFDSYVDKCIPVGEPFVQVYYDNVMDQIHTMQSKGKTQSAILAKAYGYGKTTLTIPLVNNICNAIKKASSTKEWTCVKNYIGGIFDISSYSCFN